MRTKAEEPENKPAHPGGKVAGSKARCRQEHQGALRSKASPLKARNATRKTALCVKNPVLSGRDKENRGHPQAARTGKQPNKQGKALQPVAGQRRYPAEKQHKLADWSAAMESEFENLTGQLDSIKRESFRPALKGEVADSLPPPIRQILQPLPSGAGQTSFSQGLGAQQPNFDSQVGDEGSVPVTGSQGHGLAEQARQLFEGAELAQLCSTGLNAQLQRTRDGATDKSRIAELAGLVRTLRRALKEMIARSTSFVDAGVRYERDALAQIESVKLASESASRQLQLEVANLKRGAAQAAAAHKQATASWQMELDLHKAETSHGKRELSRLEAERDRARLEARRAEEMRAAIEGNVKGMKKDIGQQLRDLQVDHGEAARALRESEQTRERLEAQLQELQARSSQRDKEVASQSSALAEEAVAVRQELRQKNEALAVAQADLAQKEDECQKLAAGLAEHEALREAAAAESSSSASEAAALQLRCASLAQQLAGRDALLAAGAADAEAQADAFASELDASKREVVRLKGELVTALAQGVSHEAEISRLEAALTSVESSTAKLSEILAVESAKLSTAHSEIEASRAREAEARQAAKDGSTRSQQLEADLLAANRRLDEESKAHQALAADAAAKAARLARIEGEFEAMQEAIGTGSVDQAEMLGRLISRVASLEAAVAESHRARRGLHNQLVNLRGNIRVFCRIKPHPAPALTCLPDGLSVRAEVDGKEQSFAFDKVFGAAATQQAVFDEVSELVQSALDGYQVCLFSYGQTGAGKTHTMQGGRTAEGQGIIPRAVVKILEEVASLREKGWEYRLEASFVEVYNESLRDLLAEGKGRDVGKLPDANVVKHHPAGGPSTVVGAVRARVSTTADAAALVKRAAGARVVEATAMNAASSRSHSVFMLYVTGHHAGSSTHLLGGLNLVDLAGSERLDRSMAEGQRQKEACSINKSLSALGDVFSALSARNPHVPYRNSKLTHLLQPCLGGDGKTLMFVNVSPEAASLGETICSLRFAAKVNTCQTAARGGARRHVSNAGEARVSMAARGSLQETKRQSATATTATGAKRKALPAAGVKTAKPRLG